MPYFVIFYTQPHFYDCSIVNNLTSWTSFFIKIHDGNYFVEFVYPDRNKIRSIFVHEKLYAPAHWELREDRKYM